MNQLLPQEVVDQIMREEQHFAAAPQAFFEAWKRGPRRPPKLPHLWPPKLLHLAGVS